MNRFVVKSAFLNHLHNLQQIVTKITMHICNLTEIFMPIGALENNSSPHRAQLFYVSNIVYLITFYIRPVQGRSMSRLS